MRKILLWLYPTIILLLALAASLVTFVFPDTTVRPLVLMAFLFLCPGIAVVYFFKLDYMIIEWPLILTLSIAIDAFVAGILLYAGLWSPVHIFVILLGFCLLSAVIQFVFTLRGPSLPPSPSISLPEVSTISSLETVSLPEVSTISSLETVSLPGFAADARKATPSPYQSFGKSINLPPKSRQTMKKLLP